MIYLSRYILTPIGCLLLCLVFAGCVIRTLWERKT